MVTNACSVPDGNDSILTSDAAAPRTTDILPRKRVLGYAMGDVANSVAFQMISLFLMICMTGITGVSAGIAGAIYDVTTV